MSLDQFNLVVAPETETQAIQHVKDAGGLLDFLQDISPEDRRGYAKMSVSKQDFIDKTLIHGEQHPDILPQYTNLESFRNGVTLVKCLERVHAQVKPLNEKLQDTIMLARAEVYEVARAFYSAVKEAAKHGVPEMEHILKDLSYHFRKISAPPQTGEAAKTAKTGNTANTGDAN